MIFPGHVAAPVLASRYLDIDRRLAVLAGVMPDLIDKAAFYVLHASHWTRLPAHSPLFFVATSLAVALAGRLLRRDWRWGLTWAVGYALHLLCDLIPPDGILPWAWPWHAYGEIVSRGRPWFLGGGPVPWLSVSIEAALVAAALLVELLHRRRARLAVDS
ncbi:MAG TPA: metal-dependent hydrolase [Anaerolineae bacterium]|nr:metal-dependent hydrolase [Anaerolineae bacterium]HPL26700.1 metal-dependent hydrolase [Anaerolineae bacterium]